MGLLYRFRLRIGRMEDPQLAFFHSDGTGERLVSGTVHDRNVFDQGIHS